MSEFTYIHTYQKREFSFHKKRLSSCLENLAIFLLFAFKSLSFKSLEEMLLCSLTEALLLGHGYFSICRTPQTIS